MFVIKFAILCWVCIIHASAEKLNLLNQSTSDSAEAGTKQTVTQAKDTTILNITVAPPTTNISTNHDHDLCIDNFGECVKSVADCEDAHAILRGVCGNATMICCIANQKEQKTWPDHDLECRNIYGSCNLDTDNCTGVMNAARCAGPSHRQCCSPSNATMAEWTDNDASCLQAMGVCQHKSNICSGVYQEGTCGGPDTRQCCVPDADVQTGWKKFDVECENKWGTCQANHSPCKGGEYQTGLCGGPQARECCVPSATTTEKWKENDTSCMTSYGSCQHDNDKCNGTKSRNLCQGPENRICCSKSQLVQNSWSKHDIDCMNAGGSCQHSLSKCDGAFSKEWVCGGPEIRQCCISPPNSKSDTSSGNNGLSRQTILLIVAGCLSIVVLVLVGFLIAKKITSKSYKRVKDNTWYERNGTEETVTLTSCEEKLTYA